MNSQTTRSRNTAPARNPRRGLSLTNLTASMATCAGGDPGPDPSDDPDPIPSEPEDSLLCPLLLFS